MQDKTQIKSKAGRGSKGESSNSTMELIDMTFSGEYTCDSGILQGRLRMRFIFNSNTRRACWHDSASPLHESESPSCRHSEIGGTCHPISIEEILDIFGYRSFQ